MSIFGLAVLLLLSPCKVQNFIQAELGIPQAKVLNKSQSAISQSNCLTYETSEAIQTIFEQNVQQPDYSISEAYSFELIVKLPKHSLTQKSSRSQLVSDVPLYILYQNLQVYS